MTVLCVVLLTTVGVPIPFAPRLTETAVLFLVVGVFVGLAFLVLPACARDRGRIPWYDLACFLVTLGITAFFFINATRLRQESWEFGRAPGPALAMGFAFWLLLLEAARRTAGWTFTIIVLVCSLYPVFAGHVPRPFWGHSLSLMDSVRFHVFSTQSVFGQTTGTLVDLLAGFMLFGAAMQVTGGGRFFADVAAALLGGVRGGTAKVAVLASGLFGMLSGSGVSNVYTIGAVTIPAMIRNGFRPATAAAIEANAGNGGALTPPVMGATAFLMATVLGVPYSSVALAAAIPALLFYASLLLQIDAYAARHGIRGLAATEVPRLWPTVRAGWPFMIVLGVLVVALMRLRNEALAPWIATGTLLLLVAIRDRGRQLPARLADVIRTTGLLMTELTVQLAAVGMLIGSLYVTGMAATLTSELIHLAGSDLVVLLLLGALVSFLLGTGLPVAAAYIFLAIMLAPALVRHGVDPLAAHLFILYWATLSDVTPPVAISVVAASGIAGAPLMRSMVESVRLATVKYVLPFFFVTSPALVLRSDDPVEIVVRCAGVIVAVAGLSYALQGYAPGIGLLARRYSANLVRVVAIFASLLVGGAPFPANLGGLITLAACYALLRRTGGLEPVALTGGTLGDPPRSR